MTDRKVPPVHVRTKDEVSDTLALDWLPLAPTGKRAQFAARIGASDYKIVSKAISGEHLPEAHTILNSLVVDPSALLNTLLLYNVVAVPVETAPCDDMEAIGAMLQAATEYFERMKDGRRDHVDTAALAKLFKPLVPAMLCVIREAAGQSQPAQLRAVAG